MFQFVLSVLKYEINQSAKTFKFYTKKCYCYKIFMTFLSMLIYSINIHPSIIGADTTQLMYKSNLLKQGPHVHCFWEEKKKTYYRGHAHVLDLW